MTGKSSYGRASTRAAASIAGSPIRKATRRSDAPEWLFNYVLGLTVKEARGQPRRTYTDDLGQVVKRAIRYLAAIPGAVSGCGGHDQTFAAARDMVYGFDLGPDVGLDLLANYYNPRCDPPWSYKELLHKCQDAETHCRQEAAGISPRGRKP